MSQPWIVACMTSALELDGDERVLEVGTGSGYGAAVLSRCCRERGHDRAPRVAGGEGRAGARDARLHNVEVRTGDGSRGAPDRAPFDGDLGDRRGRRTTRRRRFWSSSRRAARSSARCAATSAST